MPGWAAGTQRGPASPAGAVAAAPTSPFFTVMDCRRGVISSLMLDKKFCEMRSASCSSGWSGWLGGVCFSKSCVGGRVESEPQTRWGGANPGTPL